MKILHTADWHIGKKLYRYELNKDFNYFIHWLTALVAREKVDVLLVSGDVFDTANPSSESRKLFYNALIQLKKEVNEIIITGGNHDSPAVLNAPKDILRELNVKVVGSLPENIAECIFPIQNKKGVTEIVICAIPYLRDADLRKANDSYDYEDKIKAVQEGIASTFAKAAEYCTQHFPNIPTIAMGHLFTAGVSLSDSEREIQIGNEAKFDAKRLHNHFDYIALGHIHKPQKVNADCPVYYSGSPIPLSFSERKDHKRVLLIDTQKGFTPQSIAIPSFRKLIRISGDLKSIEQKLANLNEHLDLKSLLEIELKEPTYSPEIEDSFNHLINEFKKEHYEIVKTKIYWEDKVFSTTELYQSQENLEDLAPTEVFSKLLSTQSLSEEVRNQLIYAFSILLDETLAEES